MGSRKVRYVAGGLVILAVVASLTVYAVKKNLVYYYSVSEIQRKGAVTAVRVSGQLVNGTIVKGPTKGSLTFRIRDKQTPGSVLSVSYRGQVPDSFRDDPGVEVVVGGDYSGNGNFEASFLLTQCPSRYDAAREKAKEDLSTSTTLPGSGSVSSGSGGN